MNNINEHTEIFTIDHFLTDEECDQLIFKSEEMGFEEAKVNIDGQQAMMKMIRDNERILYHDLNYAGELWERLKVHIRPVIDNAEAIGLNELFRFYKYSPGQRFKMHKDGSFIRNETEFSYYTFMVYLNEGYQGGETKFKSGEIISPKKGMALIFEHSQRHEGDRLVNGIKYVLRSDIMYRRGAS